MSKKKDSQSVSSPVSTEDLLARRRELEKELASVKAELAARAPKSSGQPRIGGSFPPPLDASRVALYRSVAEGASPPVREAMEKLCDMVDRYLDQPAPTNGKGYPHPVGIGLIQPMDRAVVEAMDEVVPYEHECEMYRSLFDKLPSGMDAEGHIANESLKDIRDAAHHLLWYAIELTNDRDPQTQDKILGRENLEMRAEKSQQLQGGHVPITLR